MDYMVVKVLAKGKDWGIPVAEAAGQLGVFYVCPLNCKASKTKLAKFQSHVRRHRPGRRRWDGQWYLRDVPGWKNP
jgi:hypothetical protein